MAAVKNVTGLGTVVRTGAPEPKNNSKVVDIAKSQLLQHPTSSTSFFTRNATALKASAGALAVGVAAGGLVATLGAEAVAAKAALVYLSVINPILYMLVTTLGKTSLFALQHVVIPAALPMLTHAAVAAIVTYIVYYIVSKTVSALTQKGQSMLDTLSGKGVVNMISDGFESLLGSGSTAVENNDKENTYQIPANSLNRKIGFGEASARLASLAFLGVDLIDVASTAAEPSRVQKEVDPAPADSTNEGFNLLGLFDYAVDYAFGDMTYDAVDAIFGQENDVAPAVKSLAESGRVTVVQDHDERVSPAADKTASVFVDILGLALSVI